MKQIVKIVFLSSVLTGLSAYAQDTQTTPQIATRAVPVDGGGVGMSGNRGGGSAFGSSFRGNGSNPLSDVNLQIFKGKISPMNVAGKTDKTDKDRDVVADNHQTEKEKKQKVDKVRIERIERYRRD